MRKIDRKIFFFSLMVAIFVLVSSCSRKSAPPGDNFKGEALDSSISLAQNQLIAACEPDGRFKYRQDSDPHRVFTPDYNSIRHAGAIYALSMYESAFPNLNNRQIMIRASKYFVDHFVFYAQKNPTPLFAVAKDRSQTKKWVSELGGAGLGLVALLSTEKVNKGTTRPEILTGMGRFLLSMQKPDGSFFSRYNVGSATRDDEKRSLYYPGESILALAMLYEWDGQVVWLDAAENGLKYLAHSRTTLAQTPDDNWALIASAQIWPYRKKLKTLSETDILRHAELVAQSDMKGQVLAPESSIAGSYMADGRTTPTSTRLEGLLALWTILDESHKALKTQIAKSVRAGVSFVLKSQLREGALLGGIPLSVLPSYKNHSEVRIDYTQHALSAFLRYRSLQPQIDRY